ncbi:hypothetical protein FH597_08205 [Leptospira interrogans]|nr:hypothetical protein FH597_08205 [Leptospira interrogans]
MGNRTRIRKGK